MQISMIMINAESIGIKSLDNEIMEYLNVEIEEKLKTILSQAKKFMRISKRKTLKVDDLNQSLRFFNFKPLLGYDSFANAEYEKIESVNGMWRPKQNMIDLEEYLSKPIVSCPMQVFPHFHWIAIEGKRPNIPENFIREEYKTDKEKESRKESGLLPFDLNVNINVNVNQQVNEKPQKAGGKSTQKVVPPLIHNISKELQIFLENFEQRFRKEIKNLKLNPNTMFTMSKELEVSLNVIENEPGVVELMPYIIEFLMNNLSNKQYVNDPKVHMLLLHYVDAILKNSYFYIEPYLHQILTLVLSLILIENNSELLELSVAVKNNAVTVLKIIFKKYEIKYPNFIHQLLNVFKRNLIPDINNPSYLTTYGAIKIINILGPAYILDIIVPVMDQILDTLDIKKSLKKNSNLKFPQAYPHGELENTQNMDNMMIDSIGVDQMASLPKINFSLPLMPGHIPIVSSMFSEISNTCVIDAKTAPKVEMDSVNDGEHSGKIRMNLDKKMFYVYYALKESANLVLNFVANNDFQNDKDKFISNGIFEIFYDIFGEDIIPNLLSNRNINSNTGLDLFV